MRRLWLGAVGLSLSLGSAFAQESDRPPAATLGRPIPAASLGRPVPTSSFNENVAAAGYNSAPAAYIGGSPSSPAASLGQTPTIPMLAPVAPPGNLVLSDSPPSSKPMPPPDGTPQPLPPGSTPGSAIPAPTYNPGPAPNYNSAPAANPIPGPCNCGNGAAPGNPIGGGMMVGPDGAARALFTGWQPFGGALQSRVYASAEFLLWFAKNDSVPALAITSPTPATSVNPSPQPQTVLFGGSAGGLFPSDRFGGRFGLGYWFSPEQIRGIDFSFMFLGTNGSSFFVDSGATPEILRPFFNTATGTPFVQIVAQPGVSSGNLRIDTDSSLYGLDLNYRRRIWGICDPCGLHVDFLTGFRYMHLSENLQITETFTAAPAAVRDPGVEAASGVVTDHFGTINNFYGWQLGVRAERQWGRWSLDGTAKLGLGVTNSSSNVFGAQNLVVNGAPVAASGGLLALSSNSGVRTGSAFSVLPEVGLNLGYQITPKLKAFVGYSFMYWSNVVRPGDQVDPNLDAARIPNFLNPAAAPTTASPASRFVRTDYWAQGINFGIQYKW